MRTDLSKPNPKTGTVQLEWNKTGSLLLVRFGEVDSQFLCLYLTSFLPQRMSQQSSTYTRSPLPQNHSRLNCVPSSCTQNRFCMLDGIQFGKAVWRCVVARGVCTHGAMSGLGRTERRKRWLNALVCLRVSPTITP